ncbi:hypothetical protein ACLKA6_000446 [Drosophila palustris]
MIHVLNTNYYWGGVGVRWAHQRRKEELVAIAIEFGLGSEGLVEDLRKRLRFYPNEQPYSRDLGLASRSRGTASQNVGTSSRRR